MRRRRGRQLADRHDGVRHVRRGRLGRLTPVGTYSLPETPATGILNSGDTDTMYGNSGNDVLRGGAGTDRLPAGRAPTRSASTEAPASE
ncbi:hypothetical protein [Streptomyces sp. CA-210063]|uniref:hypothetical protein n=1 Tax=Streptomyces sp. CA-210063 TaxID=2801029 RepID=UPI003FA75DE4